MEIGILFPQTEIGPDPAALRDYAQAVQGHGFSHLVSYEHVLGAIPERLPKDYAPYGIDDPFHEILTTYAYMAAAAPGLGFATGILVLPQRQTALVAKQAAQLALLSGNRFRLGVGLGWNFAEFAGLGADFSTRAPRMEEQIELLRRFWSEPVVNFSGKFHDVQGCGIRPLPTARIPVWIGGKAEPALRRAAILADGFFPLKPLEGGWESTFERMRAWREGAGLRWEGYGIEARVNFQSGWRQELEEWRARGASHVYVSTSGQDHIAALQAIRNEL